jgi:hypothetical protein
MNPKKMSRRCRGLGLDSGLDLAISRFIYSFDHTRARFCKPFKEPRNRFSALAESIPWIDSWAPYKFRLCANAITSFELCFFSFAEWSERNYELSIVFTYSKWFVTEFCPFLSSAEWLGTEFRVFSVPQNRWNSDGLNQNFRLFSVPGNNIFSENGNPNLYVRVGTQESKKIRQ